MITDSPALNSLSRAKIQRKIRSLWIDFLRTCDMVRLGIFWKHRPRFQPYKIHIAGYAITLNDPRSFFYEFSHIFKHEIYNFKSTNQTPNIIDGGGYIGMATLYFKRLYPKAIVTVFEPDPLALTFLRNNIAANNLRDIKVVEKGLSDVEATVSFKPDQSDGNRITSTGYQIIPVTPLSYHITTPVDFLKLNIEGAELAVIKNLADAGKIKLIEKLCIEWHSFRHEAQKLDELLAILSRSGFRYYISSLPNARRGTFSARPEDQYYLLVYAEQTH
jgi:FkbM family methyltransferase